MFRGTAAVSITATAVCSAFVCIPHSSMMAVLLSLLPLFPKMWNVRFNKSRHFHQYTSCRLVLYIYICSIPVTYTSIYDCCVTHSEVQQY